MKKFYLFLFFGLLVLFSGCSTIEEPTLSGIADVEILTANQKKIELNANMIFQNPNGFALDLAKAKIVTLVDEIEIAEIDQTYDSSMQANAEFRMPFHIIMDIEKLYKNNSIAALTKGLKIISERKIEVHFKGNIDVGKGRAKISVPIDRKELVNF
jgi:LEA14-like dessication related protein